ncbi:MAG: cyclodeaminase/cyclohydrolase family protein [Eubacteriaceae bacterium]|jgi:formiminotetrahydrofolate cyclodeaminase|nr:cyclodeaminase/cyclohydrolase family protein [Eubacteriaceae bacterium]
MLYSDLSISGFARETFSKAPVPGGGGVAAASGALGAALAGMVCNLTSGKKKYAQYEEDIQAIAAKAKDAMEALVSLIDEDAENFIPLSKAYSLKASTPEEKEKNTQILQDALKQAAKAPIEIARISYRAIALHEELLDKGSSLAISDVGCGVALLRAALDSAWLNILINVNAITDEEYTKAVKDEISALVEDGGKKCREIFEKVALKL